MLYSLISRIILGIMKNLNILVKLFQNESVYQATFH